MIVEHLEDLHTYLYLLQHSDKIHQDQRTITVGEGSLKG